MSVARPFPAAREVIVSGLTTRAFPASVVEVGRRTRPLWSEAFGRLTYAPDAPACSVDTIFDLASLTKVICTASLAMRSVAAGRLDLDVEVARLIPDWRGNDRSSVSVRELLDHSSGLPAHMRLFETTHGRGAYQQAICRTPLEQAPGTKAVYSDLGFMLLGFLLETANSTALESQFAEVAEALDGPIGYRPPPQLRESIAPTEHDPWRGRLLQGEVHDENAAALDGVAAHAGLFGTAAAVGAFARLVLRDVYRTDCARPPRVDAGVRRA